MSTALYQPVNSADGEIRLLILHPASKHDADIICNLETVRLSENPQYEALSYTWGYVGKPDTILLNKQKFQVRENAAEALRQLRLPRKQRRLWVDAICINQDDLAERGEQVPLMQWIYGQAQQVCVWLGQLNDSGTVGMKQLQNKVFSASWRQWKVEKQHSKTMLSFTENLGSGAGTVNRGSLMEEQTFGEVRELLDRPWWRRTWIIQEAVLARNIVIMCGQETASWDSIRQLYERRKWNRLKVFGVAVDDKDAFKDDLYRTMSKYRKKWQSSPTEMSLFDILYRFRVLECTNPRDRIYGFLGIVPSVASMGIAPDYTSTTAKVYWQFARKTIQGTESLAVLHCAREWQSVHAANHATQVYSLIDQSRYHDIHALVVDGPDKKPRRAWARLPDGWERVASGKASFRDHTTGGLHEKSPLEGLPPKLTERSSTQQRILPPGWSKKWDNVGRATVAYGVKETSDEANARQERAALRSIQIASIQFKSIQFKSRKRLFNSIQIQ